MYIHSIQKMIYTFIWWSVNFKKIIILNIILTYYQWNNLHYNLSAVIIIIYNYFDWIKSVDNVFINVVFYMCNTERKVFHNHYKLLWKYGIIHQYHLSEMNKRLLAVWVFINVFIVTYSGRFREVPVFLKYIII